MPKCSEGFSRITFCQSESDVQAASDTYSALGPQNTLPSGSFGQKNPDAKVQLGIMKFLKKVDSPVNAVSEGDSLKDSVTTDKENDSSSVGREEVKGVEEVKGGEDLAFSSLESTSSFDNVPTLAFPSISTADFQFDLEKASDIIVEKVLEYVTKLGNARFVLVDLSSGSKILSLVTAKAGEKNIDSGKFLTFVGDITRLYSGGHLRCNVVANAANWRLKPGGGGVNAAIFSAAGPSLETATMERAGSLAPGKAVVVPLPSTSPLFCREGFASTVKSQETFYEEPTGKLGSVQLVSPVDFKIPRKKAPIGAGTLRRSWPTCRCEERKPSAAQDFDSKHLKNKKHWNSFNSAFFRDSVDVMEEIDKFGRATLKDEDILSMELRCHRCRSAHPNIPLLKSHIGNCRAPFPASLLQNGRLLFAADKDGTNQ
ncbi:hypothetical protein RHGRI_015525 [Rhododendron griersonianum]|uniref:Macro domain-containing protein n=1 Tax=Rhododendron griersonianum TaxID=479676 RepID=A0AAV6KDN3_9ERIC|nr:hypothetical protein RHGRI_015525 [Rhododendron griersonianum]